MYVLKKIFILCLSLTVLIACKDDNVPGIDKTEVDQNQILGKWNIHSTKAYVNVKASLKPILSPFNLDDKLQKKLDDKASGASFLFEDKMVYFFQDGILQDSSLYELDAYKIHLDNPELIGFYAPVFYIRFSDGLFITYLRRAETLELLEKDGSISSSEMGWIRTAVEDAQCELRFQQD